MALLLLAEGAGTDHLLLASGDNLVLAGGTPATGTAVFGGLVASAVGTSTPGPTRPAAVVISPREPGDIELIASCGDLIDTDADSLGIFREAGDGSLLHIAGWPYSGVSLVERSGDEFTIDRTDITAGTPPDNSNGIGYCGLPDGRVLAYSTDGADEFGTVELDTGVAQWSTPAVSDFAIATQFRPSGVVAMDDNHVVMLVLDVDSDYTRPRLEFIETEPGIDPVTSFASITLGAPRQAGGIGNSDEPILIKVGPTRVLAAWSDWTYDTYQMSQAGKRNRVLYCQLVDVNLTTGVFTEVTGVVRFVAGLPQPMFSNSNIHPLWYPAPTGDGGVCVLIQAETGDGYTLEIVARSIVVSGDTLTEGHSGLRIAEPGLTPSGNDDTLADLLLSHWFGFATVGAGDRGVVVWPDVARGVGDVGNWSVDQIPINYTKFLVDTNPPRQGGLRVLETGELIPPFATSMELDNAGPAITLATGEMVSAFTQFTDDYDREALWFVIAREPT